MAEVTLFGRKMHRWPAKYASTREDLYLGRARVEKWVTGFGARLFGYRGVLIDVGRNFKTPHAAARALERRIEQVHGRLAKVMGGARG